MNLNMGLISLIIFLCQRENDLVVSLQLKKEYNN